MNLHVNLQATLCRISQKNIANCLSITQADNTTQTAVAAKTKENNDDTVGKQTIDVGRCRNGFTASERTLSSSAIPVAVPTRCHNDPSTPAGRELYYT